MVNKESFDYPDYLSIKKSIDDMSMNQKVWSAMSLWIQDYYKQGEIIRILEIGAGIGTMIERMLDTGLLTYCNYTAVEVEPEFREVAYDRLVKWAQLKKYIVTRKSESVWLLTRDEVKIEIEWLTEDVLNINHRYTTAYFDLIIGHAIIDLLPVPSCMPDILSMVKFNGAYYFSLNFAGQTVFNPVLPGDENISNAYHNDMDKRFPDIDWRPSQTGLLLGKWLNNQGHNIIAEGPSDWILDSGNNQIDPGNLFITNILDTIEKALVDLTQISEWTTTRREQLQSGELQFYATNCDFFGITASK